MEWVVEVGKDPIESDGWVADSCVINITNQCVPTILETNLVADWHWSSAVLTETILMAQVDLRESDWTDTERRGIMWTGGWWVGDANADSISYPGIWVSNIDFRSLANNFVIIILTKSHWLYDNLFIVKDFWLESFPRLAEWVHPSVPAISQFPLKLAIWI